MKNIDVERNTPQFWNFYYSIIGMLLVSWSCVAVLVMEKAYGLIDGKFDLAVTFLVAINFLACTYNMAIMKMQVGLYFQFKNVPYCRGMTKEETLMEYAMFIESFSLGPVDFITVLQPEKFIDTFLACGEHHEV